MSYVRMNYLEYVSEEAADELEAQYVQNAPINFPDATALVFLRTGPTTASLTSVYPDQATLAETVGFEPTRRSPAYTLSRRAPSTTRPRLLNNDVIELY